MEHLTRRPFRVAIIGAGHVGMTCAYSLLLHSMVAEIVLVSPDRERVEGEAMDLNHGLLYAQPAHIWAGDYADCEGADIIVIAAGVAQRPGETRMDLLKRNAAVLQEIVTQVVEHTREAILIVVTNPVDVLTYVAWQVSGLPPAQVIGSGTVLDTARFRYLLSQQFHVEPRSVHAFIIGEHGDSQVPVWSLANIAGIRLDDYGQLNGGCLDAAQKEEIAEQTRRAAYDIIRRKGATYYAISAGLVRIIQAIVRDENSVLTVSSRVEGVYGLEEVSLSLPSVVNRHGVADNLELPLSAEERAGLERSAQAIRAAIESISRSELVSRVFIG